MGFEYFVDLHAIVDGGISVRAGHDIAHAIKDKIREGKPSISDVLVHIEPFEPVICEKKELREPLPLKMVKY